MSSRAAGEMSERTERSLAFAITISCVGGGDGAERGPALYLDSAGVLHRRQEPGALRLSAALIAVVHQVAPGAARIAHRGIDVELLVDDGAGGILAASTALEPIVTPAS